MTGYSDAVLVTLAESFIANDKAMDALDPESPSYNDHFGKLAQQLGQIEDAMVGAGAMSGRGIEAKLGILRLKLTGLHGIENDHPTIVLLDAVVEDARWLVTA